MAIQTSITQSLARRIAELQSGDASGRRELVARAVERLEVMARRMRKNFRLDPMLDTQDVMQEASIRLMKALDGVQINDVPHFFRLSALKIRQTLLDMVRRPALPAAGEVFGEGSSPGEPRVNLIGTLTHDPASLARWTEFHETIQALPDELREVVDLLWYHDLSQAEAADVLGISEKTVNRRWLRARLKLGELLTA